MSEQPKKLNASQRLEQAEFNLQEITIYLNNMARENNLLKEAIKLLSNKLDAVQKAANIDNEAVSALMIENNSNELKERVESFVKQGVLVSDDFVTDASFIVGREFNTEGVMVNPRVQFAVASLKPDHKEKILDQAVGSMIVFSEDTLRLEINEIYNIVAPPAPEAPQAEAVMDAAPEAEAAPEATETAQ